MYLMLYFNSIKVRLKLIYGNGGAPSSDSFQFHKGTIKTSAYADASDPLCDFNSIKVRLNLLTVEQGETVLEFQFHKGTIKPAETGKEAIICK